MAAMTWTNICSRSLSSGAPQRVAAIFGRKIRGPSSRAVGPAQPYGPGRPAVPGPDRRVLCTQAVETTAPRPACGAGSHHRSGPGRADIALRTGPGRNWASLCKPVTDAFGPVLGEDPTRPFYPHKDRIVSLALHHTTGTSIARASADARPWRRTEHDVSASDEPGHPHRSIFSDAAYGHRRSPDAPYLGLQP